MNGKTFILGGLCLTTALITSVSVQKAQAGFQWNPAAQTAPASPSVAAQPSAVGGPLTPMPGEVASIPIEPVSEVDMMDGGKPLAPVTTANNQAGMKTLNMNGSAPQSLAAAPESIESDVMLPLPGQGNSPALNGATMPPLSPVSTAADAPVVEGFGKDIPLAVALRQIVPPAYNISISPGLDQGKPVSWNGGRAWPDVVSSMLATRKLHATLNGKTVTVAQGAGADLRIPANIASDLPVIVDDANIASNNAPNIDSSPAVSPSGRPVLNLGEQKHWAAKPGQGLRETLLSWSKLANVELAWQDVNDAPIGSAFAYDGTFDQAVDSLLSLYGGGANEPHGKLYPNLPEGPSVLVISSSN